MQFMIDPIIFIQNLVLALLLGGLIGLERERNFHRDGDEHEFGGIRTLSLSSVFGFLVYSLFGTSILLFITFSVAFIFLVLISYVVSSYFNKSSGATTELASFFVYLIGVLVAMDQILFASIITLLVVLLLYFKQALHSFAHNVDKEEIYDTLKFIAIAFIVLPLLPNEVFGPLSVLNPHTIWFVVVIISTISFVSYVAIKVLGPRNGIGLGGFLGGLISSTAVSMSFSDLSKRAKTIVNPFVFGIIIASSAMFFRVIVEVSVLNPDLLAYLLVPLLTMGSTGMFLSLIIWLTKGKRKAKFSEKDLHLHSPFKLSSALKFGVLFASILFITKFASIYFGDQGIYLTAFISGFMDVDAITVSMADLTSRGEIGLLAGATAVTIATITNTFTKGLIVLFFGSKLVGRRTFIAMLVIVAAGILSLTILAPIISAYGIT